MASANPPDTPGRAPQAQSTLTTQLTFPGTVCITLGEHLFLIPVDPLDAFRYIRELTITSLQSYANDHATPREVAFIFADGSIMEEDGLGVVIEDPFRPGGGGAVGDGALSTVDEGVGCLRLPQDRPKRKRDDECANSPQGGLKSGASMPQTASVHTPGQVHHNPAPIDNDRSKYQRSGQCAKSQGDSARYVPSSTEVPAPYTRVLHSYADPTPPIIRPLPQTPANSAFRYWKNKNPFIGDYLDLEDAKRKTGKSQFWLRSNYVDGLISFKGEFAVTENVYTRCNACVKYKGFGRGCTKLVGGTDEYVEIDSCAVCLMCNSRCSPQGSKK